MKYCEMSRAGLEAVYAGLKIEYEDIKKKVIELGYYEKEEDVLSYAVFEQVAENFFKWREAQKKGVDRDMAKTEVYPV